MAAEHMWHAPDNLSVSGSEKSDATAWDELLERVRILREDVEQEKAETVNKLEEITEKLDNVAGKVISLTCIVKHLQRKHAEQNKINDYLACLYTKTSHACCAVVGIWAGITVLALAYIRKQ